MTLMTLPNSVPKNRVFREIFLTLFGAFALLLDRHIPGDGTVFVLGLFAFVLGVSGLKDIYRAYKDEKNPEQEQKKPRTPAKGGE